MLPLVKRRFCLLFSYSERTIQQYSLWCQVLEEIEECTIFVQEVLPPTDMDYVVPLMFRYYFSDPPGHNSLSPLQILIRRDKLQPR